MDFSEIKNKSISELLELLKEKRSELHAVRLKERTRQLKQVHQIRALKKTIAKLEMALADKRSTQSTK